MNKHIIKRWMPVIMGFYFTAGMLYGGEWETGPSLNTPRAGASAVVLGNYIYVLGGKTTNGVVLNTVERYDETSGVWDSTSVAPFDKPRFNAAAIVFDNKIFIIGGRDDEGEVLKKVEFYDPVSNSWDEVEQMDNHREEHVAVLLRGAICVIGGKDEYGNSVDDIEWFQAGSWFSAPSNLNQPKQSPFAAAIADTIYLFGGFTPFLTISTFKGTASAGWIFSWDPLSPLQTGRGYGATAQLADSIYLMGGRTLNDTTDIMEIFHPETETLTGGHPLPTPRAGMAAATLRDQIFLIGGIIAGQGNPSSLVQIYSIIVGIEEPQEPLIPENFAQIRGYPNPFNGAIELEVEISRRGLNEIVIYDVQGRKVKSIYRGNLTAGKHTFRWEASDDLNLAVTTGLYFAVLKGNNYVRNFKVVYVK
jgi:N-acetylneuraminic acid mutarotase